jgi:hypothetical protein
MRFLERCHTSMLVIHGESGVRVPISQGKSFSMGSAFWAARRRWCAALVSSTFFRRWSIKETRLSACSAGMTRT